MGRPAVRRLVTKRSRTVARRVGWALADQAVSSLTNFGLRFVIARGVTTSSFGAFGVAFSVYTLAILGARALGSEPLAVRYTGVAEDSWQRGTKLATGSSAAFGVLVGVGCLFASMTLSSPLAPALVILGLGLPGLLIQDAWRFAFVARGGARSAVLNDLAWAGLFGFGLAVLLLSGEMSIGPVMTAWVVAGVLSAVLGAFQGRLVPTPRGVIRWWREQKDLASPFMGAAAAEVGANHLALLGVAGLLGYAAVGSIHGAYLLFAPLQVIFFATNLFAVPEGVRLLGHSVRKLRSGSKKLSLALFVLVLIWGGALSAMPNGIGVALLGATWTSAKSVLLPVMMAQLALGARSGASVGLRALALGRRTLGANLVASILSMTGTIVGAAVAGLPGAVWGWASGAMIGSTVWWWHFGRATQVPGRSASSAKPRAGEESSVY